ncbi:MAG: hypothetical protein ACRETN_04930 [Nevskiales bacterium]
MKKLPFLAGVFVITFTVLIQQIVQTRILSVIAWYYLAFFAISVAMLGMTVGAVWVYLRREQFRPEKLAATLSDYALLNAISLPLSIIVQFSLVTNLQVSLSTVSSWSLLLAAMAVPYVFSGIVVSLALTRSPFPVGQVYGVDLLGAALGCVAVVLILNVVDGPSTMILAGALAAVAAWCFAHAADEAEQSRLRARPWWRKPAPFVLALGLLAVLNASIPVGFKPMLVKDRLERAHLTRYEKWNSYSRILATRPESGPTHFYLWGPSPKMPPELVTEQAVLNIDGEAGTVMYHYDGTRESIDFLRYDIVNLAYNLPGIQRAAIIGVGGGRDLMSAHLYGTPEIVGVELNPIFIKLHTEHPFYKSFSNLATLPNLQLFVDDARSWFASTAQKFDLVQMSMIDTWAATGAGAFSLSENGLYTLEGWRAFIKTLNDGGVFTVSRWYNPDDVNETGRMIGLATAAVLDAGAVDARPHLFVARARYIATLVLSKQPFTAAEVRTLRKEVERRGFEVLLAPDQPPASELLQSVVASPSISEINRVTQGGYLDLSVPTDNRPFFFNQLRFSKVPEVLHRALTERRFSGVLRGNFQASGVLLLILFISTLAVITTVLLPLRKTVRASSLPLVTAGTLYFAFIGMGFMLAEISLLQYFSVYLGHPIYSLGVCLFSLILATGLGSLASDRFQLRSKASFVWWGLAVAAYLACMQYWLTDLFHATTDRALGVRIAISLAAVMPLGFLLGFAFPTGMRLVQAVDREPTPWFWGINGATGVLASVLAVMLSMAFGINVTMLLAGVFYAGLIPISFTLLAMGERATLRTPAVSRS